LTVHLQKKLGSNVSEFLRSLIELTANIEDQIEAQELVPEVKSAQEATRYILTEKAVCHRLLPASLLD